MTQQPFQQLRFFGEYEDEVGSVDRHLPIDLSINISLYIYYMSKYPDLG